MSRVILGQIKKYVTVCSVGVIALMLTGCGGSATENTTKHYRLPSNLSTSQSESNIDATAKTNLKNRLVVDSIVLADHLSNINLTFQTTDVNYTLAENHLWISPLSQQLQLDLVNHLDKKLPNWFVTAMPLTDRTARLTVNINDFNPRFDGQVVLSGKYTIQFNASNKIISAPFSFITPQTKDGYDESVRVLYESWSKQLDIIANQL